MNWKNAEKVTSRGYKCGYCASDLASEKGYIAQVHIGDSTRTAGRIYICHKCDKPTFFDYHDNQTPGPIIGNPVRHIPNSDIDNLFNEAKSCFSR